MEAGAFAEELTCAVCLQVYQDPVILPCQHSFCLKCINDVWAHAAGPGGISCPQCRRKFNPRPSLEKNFTLRNIVEKYNQSQTAAECTPVKCEYCIESPSPAVKTCLKCETSFCSLHLKPHLTKETYKDHTLIEPIADLTTRQCLDHKKELEFYCEEDEVCVCISCTVIGKHKSHTLLSLDQAEAKIKENLKKEVENLHRVQKNCSIEQQDLKKSETEIKTRTNELKGNLSKKFSEWRKQLEEDEKYALKLIDEEELRVLSQIRSRSESLAKNMKQIQLIDDDAQKQLQRDCLSFIQDSKQLLSRISQFSRLQDTVELYMSDHFMAVNENEAWGMNFLPPQFQQAPRFSHGLDSYSAVKQTRRKEKHQQATSFRLVNDPFSASNWAGSRRNIYHPQRQQATRDTVTQNITLNLTNVFELLSQRMVESNEYQSAILEMLSSDR